MKKRTAIMRSRKPLQRKAGLPRSTKPMPRKRVKPRRKRNVVSVIKGLPYRVLKDGREVCRKTPAGLAEYKRRRDLMYERDNGICCNCGEFIPKGQETFEHKNGRGLGGNRRDDRIEHNGVSHFLCNSRRGGGRWYEA